MAAEDRVRRVHTVKDSPNVQIAEYPDNGYYYIGFNIRDGHIVRGQGTCAKRSRCASTTGKTVEVATGGNGVPVQANTPPFSWAYNPNVKPVRA